MGVYRANFKSEEVRGAPQPNDIVFGAADDATATTIGASLATLIAGDYMSLTSEHSKNYAKPYPPGTSVTWRCVGRRADGSVAYTFWLYDVKSGSDPVAAAAALATAGIHDPVFGNLLTQWTMVPVDVSTIVPV